ncbi:MAG: hypothetical protein JXA21_22845, partial [Anaerolineae bacterium]|nr:hypothetical protein [Anaerolineae bacterium]
MAEPATNNVLDFEIHILPQQGERYPVQIRLGDGGDFTGSFAVPDIAGGNPVQDGQRLFNTLFADSKLRTAWDNARGRESQYRVRLWIDAAAAELHTLP